MIKKRNSLIVTKLKENVSLDSHINKNTSAFISLFFDKGVFQIVDCIFNNFQYFVTILVKTISQTANQTIKNIALELY